MSVSTTTPSGPISCKPVSSSEPQSRESMIAPSTAVVARLDAVTYHYGRTLALAEVTLEFSAGQMTGLIGPDGVGKSTLLSLVAGARAVQRGRVETLGGDMARRPHRDEVCARVAYMPQGLGKNLYPT